MLMVHILCKCDLPLFNKLFATMLIFPQHCCNMHQSSVCTFLLKPLKLELQIYKILYLAILDYLCAVKFDLMLVQMIYSCTTSGT